MTSGRPDELTTVGKPMDVKRPVWQTSSPITNASCTRRLRREMRYAGRSMVCQCAPMTNPLKSLIVGADRPG